jgi:putative transposase
LFELAKATRELILEEFRRRGELYERTGKVDTSIMPAYRNKQYLQYKKILGAKNFDETLRFISENFKNFRELLEMKKRGQLPKYMDPKPPKNFKRLIIMIRYDNYKIDSEQRTIKLKYYNLELRFKGNLRWNKGKQGRLMLIFNEIKRRWYAHITNIVSIERTNNNGYKCGIDIGQKFLITAACENGHVFMYKGSRLAWDYQYFKKRISMNDKLYDLGEIDRDVWLARVRALNYKRRKHFDEAFKNLARHLVKIAGVTEIYIGYPKNIAKNKPYEYNVNFWSYWKLTTRIAQVGENVGIAVFLIDESYTSKYCAYHNSEVKRSPRGLIWCPHGHVLHSDINAALNILKKTGGKLPTSFKTQSFIVTPGGIRPVK